MPCVSWESTELRELCELLPNLYQPFYLLGLSLTGSGIVSFRHPGVESHLIVRRLKQRGMIAAPRQGWVRMAPHFYISPDEIESVVAEL